MSVSLTRTSILTEADVYCFRHFLPDKQLCKGVATRRHYAHAHSCCNRARGGGFAVKLERTPKRKNRYVCSPCSHLLDADKRQSRTRHREPGVYAWGEWGPCSKTCAAGIRTRRARCLQAPCLGPGWQTTVCQLQPHCHVHGQWGMWSPWQSCSVTCDTGTRHRSRVCNNPTPRHGGKPCKGKGQEEKPCFKKHCPVNGHWSRWTQWSSCSATCGRTRRERVRMCDNPRPAHGGARCVGRRREKQICPRRPYCSVDGAWSLWSRWSRCSATCGHGVRKRSRQCTSPRPKFGGRLCDGHPLQTVSCRVKRHCPVDGQWSSWGEWGLCLSNDCARMPGSQLRSRLCNNPAPTYGGKRCRGWSIARRDCSGRETCASNSDNE
ncbi:Hemicentin-1 [Lamellibrachia satsuma]|nr:Hemicentin-1 [Lamellibrachia satsuma]